MDTNGNQVFQFNKTTHRRNSSIKEPGITRLEEYIVSCLPGWMDGCKKSNHLDNKRRQIAIMKMILKYVAVLQIGRNHDDEDDDVDYEDNKKV